MDKIKRRSPVAQHAHKANRLQVHKDRKKAQKAGYQKHKSSAHRLSIK